MVICLERCAGLHTAQRMPLPLTVSCFSKIQIGFTFLVPPTWVVPEKGPLNVCVCVCVCVCYNNIVAQLVGSKWRRNHAQRWHCCSAGLPPELYTILEAYPWRFGESYCLFKTFLTEMTSSASILTITAFTVERYLAICHSLRAQTTAGLSRAVRVVVAVWVAACLTAVPYPIHTRTYHYLRHPATGLPLADSLICTIPSRWMPSMRYAFQVLFVKFSTDFTTRSR